MVTMLKNKCSVWKRIKFPTFWYNCYYFTRSDTYFIQLETLLINHPSYIPPSPLNIQDMNMMINKFEWQMNAGGFGLGLPNLLSLNAMNGMSKLLRFFTHRSQYSSMMAPHSGNTCFRRKNSWLKANCVAEQLLFVLGKSNIPVTVPTIEPRAD